MWYALPSCAVHFGRGKGKSWEEAFSLLAFSLPTLLRDVAALNLYLIPHHIEMQAVLPANDEERALLKLIGHESCHLDEPI